MMRLLLDSHALIWHYEDSRRLGAKARDAVNSADSAVFISVATVWELTIKIGLGKLRFAEPLPTILDRYTTEGAFEILPVTKAHALGVASLPRLHRDPFDRLLVAQAIHEDMTLVTVDGRLDGYPVKRLE